MMTPQQSAASLPRNVKILGLASLFNDIGSEAIFPLLPAFLLSTLGGSPLALGTIEGAADALASLLKLWSGGSSDRPGTRKGFIVNGYGLTALARPLITLTVAPWQLLTIRLSDRFGKGIRTAPRDALIADSADPAIRGRAFGFHRAMDNFGAAVGPLLAAGFLALYPNAFRTLFFLTIVPGLAVVGLLVFALRDRPHHELPPADLPDSSSPSASSLTLRPFGRTFRIYLLSLLIFTLGNSSDAFLLVRAGQLGVPAPQLPLLWCAFNVLSSAGNLFFGRAVDRFGPRIFLALGWLVYAAVYVAFGLATTAAEAWGFFLCYAFFYALTEPAEKTLVARLAPAPARGLAYGWYNFVIGAAVLPASLIFGGLYQAYGAFAAFSWGAVLAVIATAFLAAVREPAAPAPA